MNRFRRIIRPALLYLGAWLAIAAMFSIALGWTTAGIDGITAFGYSCFYIGPAVLIGAPLVWLAPRLMERRLPTVVWIIAHAGLALTFTTSWHGAYYGLIWLLAGKGEMLKAAGDWWGWQVAYGMMIYGVMAGVAIAANSTRRLREREIAAARAESLRMRAEMQALRGQLDPHFLFNTLHSITALVRNDPPQAEEALVQFGALLRRVLDWNREGTDEVTLGEEVSFVDGCLALEQLRLGDRLRVERAFSPDALACYVPVFTVQPLVENAIRHAIAPQRAGGTLSLSAEVVGGTLHIVVSDSGPGADATQVAGANGTGLGAIRQRLQLRHGSQAALAVSTAPGRGFTVTLTLPAITEQVLEAVTG